MSERGALGPNGGDVLVAVMRARGVDTAFGVVSIHNLPLVDAIDRELRFVPVRHEAAAVNAADGYGRARGGVGVAVTSTGTGAGNAAGSLVEALTAGAAVVHVTGQVESEFVGSGRGVIHETKDQLGMLNAVSKSATRVADGDSAAKLLSAAFADATTPPRGPVSVEWPIDLQYERPTALSVRVSDDGSPDALPLPDSRALDRAAELLANARRPLVWAGGGATRSGAALSRLLDRCDAGLLTSNAGRGVIPEDDERCVGNFAASAAGTALLSEADLLVSIGTHHRSNETRHYALALPETHIQIDVDPRASGRVYRATIGLVGDAGDLLVALLDRCGERASPSEDSEWRRRVRAARTEARDDLRAAIGPQAQLCDTMRELLPRDAVIARDVTIPVSAWGNRLLEIYDWRCDISARGGGIGQGLAMGLGAAMADSERVVCVMVGDGGLAMHLGELLTLAQERPRVAVVLFNDGGYGVLRNMQDRYFPRRSGVDLHTPDFASLFAGIGLTHKRVEDVVSFRGAFGEAIAHGAPYVVEVDVDAIGPMPRPFVPPVHIPGGSP